MNKFKKNGILTKCGQYRLAIFGLSRGKQKLARKTMQTNIWILRCWIRSREKTRSQGWKAEFVSLSPVHSRPSPSSSHCCCVNPIYLLVLSPPPSPHLFVLRLQWKLHNGFFSYSCSSILSPCDRLTGSAEFWSCLALPACFFCLSPLPLCCWITPSSIFACKVRGLRGDIKYYFADFVRKGDGGPPPKSITPFR